MSHTLGESARVKFTPQTLEAIENSNGLNTRQKHALRLEKFKEYVKSKPYGTWIKNNELRNVLGIKTEAAISVFLKQLVKSGKVYREELGRQRYYYVFPESEVKITKPAAVKEAPEPVDDAPLVGVQEPKLFRPDESFLTVDELTDRAIRWSWLHPEADNDLRLFIASLNGSGEASA